MKSEPDQLIFETSGRRQYAKERMIGIARRSDGSWIICRWYDAVGGYDAVMESGDTERWDNDGTSPTGRRLTLNERRELAEYMARMWREWGGG